MIMDIDELTELTNCASERPNCCASDFTALLHELLVIDRQDQRHRTIGESVCLINRVRVYVAECVGATCSAAAAADDVAAAGGGALAELLDDGDDAGETLYRPTVFDMPVPLPRNTNMHQRGDF